MVNSNKGIVAKFRDRFGEERVIHTGANGVLKVKRRTSTPVLAINQSISALVGEQIRQKRLEKGWTGAYLCRKAGLSSSTPKSRMWEIERGVRKEGVRLGTLYAIAAALNCEVGDLLPSVNDVIVISGSEFVEMATLQLRKALG